MSNLSHSQTASEMDAQRWSDQPLVYQIRLQGHLGRQWATWFGGMTITLTEKGDTLLTGPVTDQAALFGLLKKIRDLGLPLISLLQVQPDGPDICEDTNWPV